MVNVYIKERINDQTTICAGGVTSNTTYLGASATARAQGGPCFSRGQQRKKRKGKKKVLPQNKSKLRASAAARFKEAFVSIRQ